MPLPDVHNVYTYRRSVTSDMWRFRKTFTYLLTYLLTYLYRNAVKGGLIEPRPLRHGHSQHEQKIW